ncbi:phosphotransferase family protein [Nocardia puris]|uniref:Aminoglycoside phosphotransferase (APT) family kinase protein n=1 Tax=Nocardia puris TaxID=208602 RepID=A0A366DDY1_9NOCA|nr:phosphotransferase family protein [Nocardia puris]MBF6215010.1 phosphotransferase family protein [Nocardia puris]MBF6367223.1 phosphotransferase family protein [Nocardia puris]MBF6461800.1 phosphotransferase family protein [Nocardia puris]RBO88257.1 aminoglycoside phosphotransferase (APT) family kinase protein [Nocardia puris]
MSVAQPVAVDREVVDFAIVGKWMDEQGLPGGDFEGVTSLGGGTQNIMLRFTRGGRDYVLRRGPKHLRAKSNEVIRREARLLGALDATEVRSPRVIAACTDETLIGAVFYLMEPITGFNPQNELPALHAGDPEVRRQMGLSAVEAIARLGSLDYQALGLADYGKPDGFLERQVPRWLGELESYSANEGYPGPAIPALDRVGDWLERHRPADWTPGILHGDCHLANMMFDYDGPEVAAMVDWEMSTIGDPLLDLGWQIATRPDPGSTASALVGKLGAAGGLPTPEEMIAHYARFSDRDLSAVTWYTVLACFKLGIVLEGTYARAFANKAPKQVGDFLHAVTLELFEKADRLLE